MNELHHVCIYRTCSHLEKCYTTTNDTKPDYALLFTCKLISIALAFQLKADPMASISIVEVVNIKIVKIFSLSKRFIQITEGLKMFSLVYDLYEIEMISPATLIKAPSVTRLRVMSCVKPSM